MTRTNLRKPRRDVRFSPPRSHGSLAPDSVERPELCGARSVFLETVRIEDRLVVKCVEAGVPHELVLIRQDLGIPKHLSRGKLRFTYVDRNEWRVRLLEGDPDA